jgi:hypothetical protein
MNEELEYCLLCMRWIRVTDRTQHDEGVAHRESLDRTIFDCEDEATQ